MDGSFGPQGETAFGFAPGSGWEGAIDAAPADPHPAPVIEPEWSLSAGQVALTVAAVIGFCELIGRLF